ncbi:hypothetical protein BGZ47_010304 [Haplosporangium gracile]|nr:hypothetical protein BGZ47_010304 [Haplosporangium gracile]
MSNTLHKEKELFPVNIALGFFLIAWGMVPIAYYTNLWDAQRFPILTADLFRTDGDEYGVDNVLKHGILYQEGYDNEGRLCTATFFALTYGIGFAGLSSMITQTWFYRRHKLVAQWKQSRTQAEDIHHWWCTALFVGMIAISVFTCEYYGYMPWRAVFLAILLAVVFALPVGLIHVLTNQQPGLNITTKYVISCILPGEPVPNVAFKSLGYISMTQAMLFTSGLKFSHYMKVPHHAMFWAQLLGTTIAGLINLIAANWLLNTQPDICTKKRREFKRHFVNTFYSASVIWGVIAPNLMFGPSLMYNAVNYFFVLGLGLPLPFYFIKKAYPNT